MLLDEDRHKLIKCSLILLLAAILAGQVVQPHCLKVGGDPLQQRRLRYQQRLELIDLLTQLRDGLGAAHFFAPPKKSITGSRFGFS